jgi:anti-anti-sigma factor
MKIIREGSTLSISDLGELAVSNRRFFTSETQAAINDTVSQIDIDLSSTQYADCGGVGALIALRKSARCRNHNIQIRLLNPTLPVRRLFNLTQINCIFSVDRAC